jgi:nucleoside-diphosphate-sugar epimerase
VPLAIFRIAGIYGPGRNALKNIADGKARRIVKPGQVFNRIHVDDIALAVAAAIEHNAHGIFNLADDEPSPPEDVVEFAARLMGVPVPPAIPFETAELTPMARSFYGDSKRVSNRRIREELAVALSYPTYRDGLATMWRDGSWRRR